MATVHVPKLYRVTSLTVRYPLTLTPDDVLWMHSNRRSTLGGYIGRMSTTYPHRNAANEIVGYSPSSTYEPFEIHLDSLEAIPSGGPLRFATAQGG